MKRLLTSILLFAAFLCGAQAQNDALFVYRNDGAIHGFLRADIDSMVCSQIDLDSLLHADYVVQEIWTADSVYRIPLAAIDSISFVTPPTIYKEGVTKIEESLLPYVVGADSLTLKLKSETPSYLLPQTGDLLVLLEGCEVLPYGFAGKVETVNTLGDCVEVVCEQTYIEDVFDSYCSVQTMAGYAEESGNASSQRSPSDPNRVTFNPNDWEFHFGPYTFSLSGDLNQKLVPDGNLALKGGGSSSITVEPTLRIHTFLIVFEEQGTYFNCSITGNLEVTSQTSAYGGLEWEHEFLNPVFNVPIPRTGGLVNFYFNPGLFVRASATITSTLTDYRNYTFGMAYDYSSKGENVVKPSLGGRLASSSTDMEGSIDGSAAWGAYVETGFNLLSREISRVCVRGEYGMQLSGNFVLRNTDIENAERETVLYERLKASSLELGPFVNASLIASVATSQAGLTWQMSEAREQWDLVPTFSNTRLTHTPGSATSADAYTELSGNCLLPMPVGYKLFDADMNEVADYDASVNYTNQTSRLEHSFGSLNQGEDYTVYPTVKFFGYEMLATPSAELTNAHPVITAFEVTDSEHKEGAFMNDGRYYDYKFDVALTAEIDNLEGVADWGYVYRDPYGNVKRISLMEYGQSYTDTRYAYYRNEAHSTACLYTYVRYEGASEYYDGEPHDYPLDHEDKVFSCPDNHHPHAIDLGLPSGTKWACCNIGASSPEGYGGYYAWGETSEKSEYTWDNYAYYNSQTGDFISLGSDIAGTSYDVAHVQWGGSWVMPSHVQQRELVEHCSREWTTVNGVNGVLVTGPSGGQIFLPAAGSRWDGYLSSAGSDGNYWSSTQYPDSSIGAYSLNFYSDYWYWYNRSRNYGQSVRAVCP